MAHVKAEVLDVVCCNGLMFPLTNDCNDQDESNTYCDVKHGDYWDTGIHCKHSKIVSRFIERTYKRFDAAEHDPAYDYLFGCWDLIAGPGEYICSYLEIDGHVYCDVRGEYTGYDPRQHVVENDSHL